MMRQAGFRPALLLSVCIALPALLARAQTGESSGSANGTSPPISPTPPASSSILDRTMEFAHRYHLIDLFSDGLHGFRLGAGSSMPSTGLALGPEYTYPLGPGGGELHVSAVASTSAFYVLEAGYRMPMPGRKWFAEFNGVRSDFPQVNYYGPGPNSARTGRSNYRFENTSFDVSGGFRPARHLRIGAGAGYLLSHVGPGTDEGLVSSLKIYRSDTAPGIDRQPSFLRAGPFVQYDTRDSSDAPTAGGNYLVRYSAYSDRTLGQFSFDRIDAEARHYTQLGDPGRVLALRSAATRTDPGDGQHVPFYLEPVLGGPRTLRGFRPYRFSDENLILMNAEYRWYILKNLGTTLFADAGKVFPHGSGWGPGHLESSYGFGLRVRIAGTFVARMDLAFSREKYAFWINLGEPF
jgi:hypothetical protein